MLNCEAFLKAVWKQDRDQIRTFFTEDAVIRWPCTNEQFTVEEYLLANCTYPGEWDGEPETVERMGDRIVVAARVWALDRSASFHCVSFLRCHEGRIAAMDEYWADDGAPPKWRQKMQLGTPIRREA